MQGQKLSTSLTSFGLCVFSPKGLQSESWNERRPNLGEIYKAGIRRMDFMTMTTRWWHWTDATMQRGNSHWVVSQFYFWLRCQTHANQEPANPLAQWRDRARNTTTTTTTTRSHLQTKRETWSAFRGASLGILQSGTGKLGAAALVSPLQIKTRPKRSFKCGKL